MHILKRERFNERDMIEPLCSAEEKSKYFVADFMNDFLRQILLMVHRKVLKLYLGREGLAM